MNELKTIKVKAVSYDEDNNIDGGVDIYWVPGAHVVLYQTWEDGLLDYFLENWTKGEIEYHLDPENPVNENYC
jgi:hypothetical protein